MLKTVLLCIGAFLLAAGFFTLLALSPYIVGLIILLMNFEVGDELLLTSASPTGAYVLEVHRMNPGATEPFYIHVRRTDGGQEELIYSVRGEDSAEVEWLSEEVVRINSVTLNVPAGETYKGDTHYPESVIVTILIEAEDVYALEAEHLIARDPLGGQSVMNARYPAEPLAPGERVSLEFTHRHEIPMEDSLEQGPFGMVLTVHTGGDGAAQLPFLYEWTTDWYRVHDFTLTGSAEGGFTLTPAWDGCAIIPLEEAFGVE